MKKLWLTVLCGLLAFGLAACGDGGGRQAEQGGEPMWLLTAVTKYTEGGAVERSKVIEYNADGTPASVSWQNENGETTKCISYSYDDDGKLCQTVDVSADGSRLDIEYTYDEAGREVSVRHWDGAGEARHLVREITTVYEDGGKYQDSLWYDDAGAVSYTAHIVYDEQDNLLNAATTNADGTVQSVTEWAYDEAGREVAYRQYDGDGALTYSYDTAYDERGNKVKVSGGGFDETGERTTEYEYDEQGNLLREINRYADGGEVMDYTDYTYDEDGHKIGQVYYIGGPDDAIWADGYRYVYDDEGNPVKQELVDEDGRVYAWREFEYTQVMVPTERLEQVQTTQKEWRDAI